jgi:two-component system chemotaxis response regulator CheY
LGALFLSFSSKFDILLFMNLQDTKIVVVDDSDFSRSMIKKMLEEEGIQIVGEAASAEAALSVIKDQKPHIVITDIVMPEVSGIELTEKINQNFDNIAVIVVSSLSQEHIVLEAIGAGASDFIAKPIQKQQLMDSIEKISSALSE